MSCGGKFIKITPECPYERAILLPRRTDLILTSQGVAKNGTTPFNYDDATLTFRVYQGEHDDTVLIEIADGVFSKTQSQEAIDAGDVYNDVWSLIVPWDVELALLDSYNEYWYEITFNYADPQVEFLLWRGPLKKDHK